jgi:hypothetical protein
MIKDVVYGRKRIGTGPSVNRYGSRLRDGYGFTPVGGCLTFHHFCDCASQKLTSKSRKSGQHYI